MLYERINISVLGESRNWIRWKRAKRKDNVRENRGRTSEASTPHSSGKITAVQIHSVWIFRQAFLKCKGVKQHCIVKCCYERRDRIISKCEVVLGLRETFYFPREV